MTGILDHGAGAVSTVTFSFDGVATDAAALEVHGETGTLSVPDPNFFEGSELDAVLREGMLTVTLPPHSFATVELNLEPELTAIEREEVTS